MKIGIGIGIGIEQHRHTQGKPGWHYLVVVRKSRIRGRGGSLKARFAYPELLWSVLGFRDPYPLSSLTAVCVLHASEYFHVHLESLYICMYGMALEGNIDELNTGLPHPHRYLSTYHSREQHGSRQSIVAGTTCRRTTERNGTASVVMHG